MDMEQLDGFGDLVEEAVSVGRWYEVERWLEREVFLDRGYAILAVIGLQPCG